MVFGYAPYESMLGYMHRMCLCAPYVYLLGHAMGPKSWVAAVPAWVAGGGGGGGGGAHMGRWWWSADMATIGARFGKSDDNGWGGGGHGAWWGRK